MDSTIINADTPVEALDFSVRTYNRLKRAGIGTLSEIMKLTSEYLDELESKQIFLSHCMPEINHFLTEHGFEEIETSR